MMNGIGVREKPAIQAICLVKDRHKGQVTELQHKNKQSKQSSKAKVFFSVFREAGVDHSQTLATV